MRMLEKSVLMIGQVLGLLIGDNFTTPLDDVLEQHPYLEVAVY